MSFTSWLWHVSAQSEREWERKRGASTRPFTALYRVASWPTKGTIWGFRTEKLVIDYAVINNTLVRFTVSTVCFQNLSITAPRSFFQWSHDKTEYSTESHTCAETFRQKNIFSLPFSFNFPFFFSFIVEKKLVSKKSNFKIPWLFSVIRVKEWNFSGYF